MDTELLQNFCLQYLPSPADTCHDWARYDNSYSRWGRASCCILPIPTAHHWKKEVKALLDQNYTMGVMEPLPAGILQTWCSRMLTTAKKSGNPRIVIELQPLNAVSKRAAHHIPSPRNQREEKNPSWMLPMDITQSLLQRSQRTRPKFISLAQ